MAVELVLASGSPRRRQLLGRAGFVFDVVPAQIEERFEIGESPPWGTVRLACEKAAAVLARCEPKKVVLAADTTVVCGGRIYGKPSGVPEAVSMLLDLGGRNHIVYTGWALMAVDDPCGRGAVTGLSASIVRLREMTRAEATVYALGGEPLDKAGAYAVQGEGRRFVAAVCGPVDNVIGLPVEPVVRALIAAGVERSQS
jgi:septum formation protein